MKVVKNIIYLVSFIAVYLIVKEFISLYFYIKSLNIYLAYVFLGFLLIVFIYFIVRPLVRIFLMNKLDGPVKDKDVVHLLIKKRIDNFKNNSYLKNSGFDVTNLKYNEESYNDAVQELKRKCYEIRKKYVTSLFMSTAIAQNGFLDALLIISASINIIQDTFKLYKGRVNNKHLVILFKHIYFSMALGGSELPEYATEEVVSKLTSSTIQSIPFFKEIASSLVDGFVNATLLTRVSLIAENYCSMLLVKDKKELYPNAKVIISTANTLTHDLRSKIMNKLKDNTIGKMKNSIDFMISPVSKFLNTAVPKKNFITSSYSSFISLFSRKEKAIGDN